MGILDPTKINWFLSQAQKKMEAEEYKNALANYLKALKLKISSKDITNLGELYRNVGICYMKMSDEMDVQKEKHVHKSAEYFKKSAENYRNEGNLRDAGISYEFAGNSHELLKEYGLAAEFDKLAAEMYSEANEVFQSSHAYYNSAQYYENLGDHEKAAETYEKAAELDLELKDYSRAAKNYGSAGSCHFKIENHKKALDVFYTAAGLHDKTGDYVSASKTHEMIAKCQEKLGKTEDAIKEHEKSYEIDLKEGLDEAAIDSLINEGRDYIKVSDHDNAIKTFLKAAEIASGEKNHELEGMALAGAASSYEAKGEYDSAIENYMRAAEASTRAKKRDEAYESHKRALELNLKLAEAAEAAGDHLSAAGNWGKIAESHSKLHDEEKSAEARQKQGMLLIAAGRAGDARESFKTAAESFGSSNLPGKAAESYIKAEEYQKAADYYAKNAVELIKEKKFFEAAESYKTSSWCYTRLQMENQVKDYCGRYAWQYHTFIDEGAKDGSLTPAKKAAALKNIGEANYRMGLLNKALPPLAEAEKILAESGDSNEIAIVSGELALITGLISANEARWGEAVGEYTKAREKLSAVDASDFDEFYSKFLEGLLGKTREAIREIESKPDILITVDQPKSVMVEQETLLNGVISNKGVLSIYKINFLPYSPEGLKSLDSPEEIEELKAGETKRIAVKIEPSEVGEYSFKPLEILYQDSGGRKYMKASNEIKVRATVSPEKQREVATEVSMELIKRLEGGIEEEYAALPKGSVVLLSYDPQIYSQVYPAVLHYLSETKGLGGVYIAAGNPSKSIISSAAGVGVDTGKIVFIDCISYLSGGTPPEQDNIKYVENPELLEEIELYLGRAISQIPGEKYLVFDSVSSMLVYNDRKSLEEFTHALANKLRLEGIYGIIMLAKDDSTKQIRKVLTQFVDKEISI